MVNIRRMGSLAAALVGFLACPALASAHLLSVSAGPSQCVSPLNGEYTATVTVTETYFGGTVENIPVGQNVKELASSTDTGNKGLNQNYFTQGTVGATPTGLINLGQPTSFTSPASGGAATQHFTVTTSVPETYVLGNSYMGSPSTATITAPKSGCTPPPPPTVSVTATTQCTAAQDGTFTATIDVKSNQAFIVPGGSTGGASGTSYLSPTATGEPASFQAGDTVFTLQGLTQKTVYYVGAPGGNVASVTLNVPSSGCTPPPTCPSGQTLTGGKCVPPTSCPNGQTLSGGQCVPPTNCPSGEVLSGGQCVPPTNCPSGETLSGGQCVPPSICPSGETLSGSVCAVPAVVTPTDIPGVCRASTSGYKLRAGQADTIVVSVLRRGTPVSGANVRISLRGSKTVVRTTGKNGKATFTVAPTRPGTIYVRSASCGETVKVKVFAAKSATAVRAPSFTG